MQPYSNKTLDEAISELEKSMIKDALKKTKGMQYKSIVILLKLLKNKGNKD